MGPLKKRSLEVAAKATTAGSSPWLDFDSKAPDALFY